MTKESEPLDGKGIGQGVLLALTEEQWLELLDRLQLFTQTHYFRIDGRDSIQDAILAVMNRRRSWDLNKTPFHNLCLIIRSITSNQLTKDKKFIQLNTDVVPPVADTASTSPSNIPHAEGYDKQERDQMFRARLREALGNDDVSLRVVNYLIETDSEWKPKKIAEALGAKKSDVNNARKRLMRKLKMFMEIPKRTL